MTSVDAFMAQACLEPAKPPGFVLRDLELPVSGLSVPPELAVIARYQPAMRGGAGVSLSFADYGVVELAPVKDDTLPWPHRHEFDFGVTHAGCEVDVHHYDGDVDTRGLFQKTRGYLTEHRAMHVEGSSVAPVLPRPRQLAPFTGVRVATTYPADASTAVPVEELRETVRVVHSLALSEIGTLLTRVAPYVGAKC